MTNNREIKFRGFHRDETGKEKVYVNGGLVKGYWVISGSILQTYPVSKYLFSKGKGDINGWKSVLIPTVGQYTGLKDKNGKEIFEGDVVATPKYGVDNGKGQNYSGKDKFVVGYSDGTYTLENGLRRFCLRPDVDAKVCGSIWDNPELLEVK